jgi:hypothetical protein
MFVPQWALARGILISDRIFIKVSAWISLALQQHDDREEAIDSKLLVVRNKLGFSAFS